MGLANASSCALEGTAPPMRTHASNNQQGQRGQPLVLVCVRLTEALYLASHRFWSQRCVHLPMPLVRHEGRQISGDSLQTCGAGFTVGCWLAVGAVLLGVLKFLQHQSMQLRQRVRDTLGCYLPLESTPEEPSAISAHKDPFGELRTVSNCFDVQDANAIAGSFASSTQAGASRSGSEQVRFLFGCVIQAHHIWQGELDLGPDEH